MTNVHWIFDLHNDNGISYIMLVTFANIYFALMSIFTIRGLWVGENKVNLAIRIISTIHCTSYLSSYLFIALMFFVPIHFYLIFFIIYSTLFSIGHLSFYAFMLLRVYYSFVDTKWNGLWTLSVKMIYCHCFILFIDFCIYVLIWICWFSLYRSTNYLTLFVVLSIAAATLLLFSIFHFIYTFNTKLLTFTINLTQYSSSTRTSRTSSLQAIDSNTTLSVTGRSGSTSSISFSQKQSAFFYVIAKQTLLSCYSLCMIIVLILLSIAIFVVHRYAPIHSALSNSETVTDIFRWFLLIERCTEISSIYLSMSMTTNDNLYLCLCKKCHQSLTAKCRNLAEKRIARNNDNKLDETNSNEPENNAANKPAHRPLDNDIPRSNPNMKDAIKSWSSVELQTAKHIEEQERNLEDIEREHEDSLSMIVEEMHTNDTMEHDDDELHDNIGSLPTINTSADIATATARTNKTPSAQTSSTSVITSDSTCNTMITFEAMNPATSE
eukprot:CAMPEP_0197037390 /NCGR_PEP_ID=MMETSP1384-20130603/14615_1 /TAXON_ID=29189 /ORGANISM="Ammonia sp." /LENGTH=494 /DNA_ID=CAMNT_0042467687 /DNA_START=25 /DNA_END=1509 /DNA_ORIENTATION=+